MAMKSPSRAQNTDTITGAYRHLPGAPEYLHGGNGREDYQCGNEQCADKAHGSTMTTAMIIANAVSYIAVGVPEARENSSSNVMENILL